MQENKTFLTIRFFFFFFYPLSVTFDKWSFYRYTNRTQDSFSSYNVKLLHY